MSLLPKSDSQFKTKEYWDKFFLKRKEAFEWYGDYFELSTVLHKYSKVKDSILVLGCGNSRLSEDLYDLGYNCLVNIDISDVVINQMKDRNKQTRPNMQFIKMDMLKMTFEEEQFNVILDKGALDAIFISDQDKSVVNDINQMFLEIQRVLKTNGRYICITLVQDHILNKLLSYFSNGWFIRVHYIDTMSPLPVFAFIFTKTKFSGADSQFPKILELCFDGPDKIERLSSLADIKSAIKNKQEYAMIKQSLRKFDPENSFSMELWSSEGHREPRYTWTVVDSSPNQSQNGLYAIFIVPQGRETEHCFNCDEGRRDLAATANYQRLVVVTLHRGHKYGDIEAIKHELSAKAMDFAPDGVTDENHVPFLSLGGDIGMRNTLEKGHSEFNGDYVIEEVFGEGGEQIRRLIFLNSPKVVQSEAHIKTDTSQLKTKKGKTKQKTQKTVDHHYLTGRHLQGLAAGLAFVDGLLNEGSTKEGLLVGLGGGNLAMFIHEFYPQIILDAVEIDPEVVKVARKWFECKEDDRLRVIIADAVDFIKTKATASQGPIYHIIIFDVNDSKETANSGLLGPPLKFLEKEFLHNVKMILHKQGALVIDFGCENPVLRSRLLNNIQSMFDEVYTLKIRGLVNEIVFAIPHTEGTEKKTKIEVLKSIKDIQNFGKASKRWNEDIDLCDIMKDLSVL